MNSMIVARNLTSQASTCLFERLLRRNLIGNIYPESIEYRTKLKDILKKPACVYAGFDATSDSLHVGNLAVIMNLMHLQKHGHRVVCVIGDATAEVGDPSGHTKDREEIDERTISSNSYSIEQILKRLFRNHRSFYKNPVQMQEPIIIRNSLWYKEEGLIKFLSKVARKIRHGSVAQKKFISERLESPKGMNMCEFNYTILQAYDWLKLRELYDCRLQIGGSDQAGNIYTGHDLIKKSLGQTDSIGLLTPLITSSETGKKLGKTADNKRSNIWLKPDRTSPYNLYQFFHRVPDKDVENYLKVYSFYEDSEIEDLIYNHLKKREDVWYCQRKLANHVCKLVHGEAGLESARRITHAFYQRNPLDIANLSDNELYELFDKDSIIHLMHKDNLSALDLTRKAGCFDSDLHAEKLISAGGVWLNGARVTSINVPITEDLIIGNGVTVMRVGKRNYFLFKWSK